MISENDRAVKSYLESKKGTSEGTQYHYKIWLDMFSSYLNKKNISLKKLKQDELIKFFSQQYNKLSPKSMNHSKSTISSFLKFMFPTDWLSRFPNIQSICKSQRVPPKYNSNQMFSLDEVQKLIQNENDPFWKTIIALQFYGGSRPSEICKLKWKDVNITNEGVFFNIYSAKNNQNFEKFVPIEFSNYLKEMQKTTKSEYCFTKNNDKPIRRSVLYKHLARLGKRVFPDKKINPYLLRHSIATILYGKAEKGELSEAVVARQMGHSASMKKTYTHLNQELIRANAKNIYIKPDYTPEQKEEYEKRIEKLEKNNAKIMKILNTKVGLTALLESMNEIELIKNKA